MSRRFGRNQKRKMRAELAKAAKDNEQLAKRIEGLIQRGRQNQEAVEMTARILGNHFIGLPPEQQRKYRYSGEFIRMRQHAPLRSCPSDELAHMATETILQLDLYGVDSRIDALRDMVHLRVENEQGRWAYAISRWAIENTPIDYLAPKLGHEFAMAIAKAIQERKAA